MDKSISVLLPNDGVTLTRTPSGLIEGQARYMIFNGRKYTPRQFRDWCENEIFRKGSKSVLRTTSPRFRAGTRRTKRIARATR